MDVRKKVAIGCIVAVIAVAGVGIASFALADGSGHDVVEIKNDANVDDSVKPPKADDSQDDAGDEVEVESGDAIDHIEDIIGIVKSDFISTSYLSSSKFDSAVEKLSAYGVSVSDSVRAPWVEYGDASILYVMSEYSTSVSQTSDRVWVVSADVLRATSAKIDGLTDGTVASNVRDTLESEPDKYKVHVEYEIRVSDDGKTAQIETLTPDWYK